METQNKKGQAALGTILTGFVVIAAVLILIVLLIFTFGTVSTGLEETKEAQSVVNETGGYINTTGYQLANGITGVPRDFVITEARNTTDNATITSGNWTLSDTGLVTNATATVWPTVKFTYTYNNDSAEITASKTAQTDTSRAIPLVGILFIILAVGAIITIIITSFVSKRRS